ncbi:MAG TPA: hypothetical protein VMT11_15910 [Myxococcaceae bacterium]|nr:hypothetical protein [Myxococcaceae bacterium]
MRVSHLVLLPLAALACAGPLTGATSFTPAYYLSGGAVPPSIPACSGPIAVTVTDVREKPQDVGRRFAEDKPTVSWPIEMTGSAPDYVRSALEANLKRAGSPGTGQGTSTLQARLTQLLLEERTYHNAEFSGSVGLDLALSAPGAATPCWRGQISATGTNYGKAGNPENYQETLNRAIERATADLLAHQSFQDALCGKCSGP